MENIKNNKNIKFIFLILWCFLIVRISSYIIFDTSVPLRFIKDVISAIIFTFLNVYLIFIFIKKKPISKTLILTIYPIIGVIGYYFNGFKNDYQESILIHHFLTLSTVLIYFAILQSNKVFNYKFQELLLKIILVFCIFYSLLNILPHVIIKLYNFQDLRLSSSFVINILENEINFKQNINGQSKFLFILSMIGLILFKKFYLTKKKISIFIYLICLFLITIIFLSQARFNILASFIISFFIIFNIKNLNIFKKFIYFLLIIFVPIITFNLYSEKKSRFSNEYQLYYTPFKNEIEFNRNLNIYNSKKDTENLTKILSELKKKNTETLKDEETINLLYYKFFFEIENDFENPEIFNYDNHIKITRAYNFLKDILNSNPDLSEINEINSLMLNLRQRIDSGKLIILRNCSSYIYYVDRLLSGRVCGWETLLKIISYKELILGKGFFADQVYLKPLEKTSSNTYINILFNTGIINLLIFTVLITIFFTNYFKIKNINSENVYLSISHYFVLYLITRAFFEDTLAFVSIDFMLFGICLILIRQFVKNSKN